MHNTDILIPAIRMQLKHKLRDFAAVSQSCEERDSRYRSVDNVAD